MDHESFNAGLGAKLKRDRRLARKKTGRYTRILLGIVIAALAAGVILTTKIWAGS